MSDNLLKAHIVAMDFIDRALTRNRETDLVKLGPADCICPKCGLSKHVPVNPRKPTYNTCIDGCSWSPVTGEYSEGTEAEDIPVEVFTQEDFENGLQNASVKDREWLEKNYPGLYALSKKYWSAS